jgi:hypothetical protein
MKKKINSQMFAVRLAAEEVSATDGRRRKKALSIRVHRQTE